MRDHARLGLGFTERAIEPESGRSTPGAPGLEIDPFGRTAQLEGVVRPQPFVQLAEVALVGHRPKFSELNQLVEQPA
ncbi:MAG: hypothetical protein ACOC9J_03770 [Persicimonas sp.]